MPNNKVIALTATGERPASTMNGYGMLIVLLLAILADAYGIDRLGDVPDAAGLTIVVLASLVFILVTPGFFNAGAGQDQQVLPLVAENDVGEAGFFGRIWASIKALFGFA